MPRAEFEPEIPANQAAKTYPLDHKATGRLTGGTARYITRKVSKAVPLHAMEALGERRGVAPTHSRPRH
jgi:hypothetical protein